MRFAHVRAPFKTEALRSIQTHTQVTIHYFSQSAARSMRSYAFGFALFMLLAGCARIDTTAIAKLAATADTASKISDAMAVDLYEQCVVAREYETISELGTTGDLPGEQLDSLPIVGTIQPSPSPVPDQRRPGPSSAPSASRTAAAVPKHRISPDAHCQQELELSRRWKDYNNGIFLYAKGIAAVAGVSVSLDSKSYGTLGSDLAKIGAIRNDAVAKAGAHFFTDIGNEILKDEKNRDIRSLVSLSQKDGVFRRVLGEAETASRSYYGLLTDDKQGIDDYFITIIGLEKQRLNERLGDDGDLTSAKANSYSPVTTARVALTKPCKPHCRRHIALISEIALLRDRIANQRQQWRELDISLVTGINRVQPYYGLMVDLGTMNDSIVQSSPPGLAGFVAAIKPHIDALAGDADALITATSPTPSPTPGSKKH